MSDVFVSKIKAILFKIIPDADKPGEAFINDESGNVAGVIVCDKVTGACQSLPVEAMYTEDQCEMPPNMVIYDPSVGSRIFKALESFIDAVGEVVEKVEEAYDNVVEGAALMVQPQETEPKAPKATPQQPSPSSSEKMLASAVEVFVFQKEAAIINVISQAAAVIQPSLISLVSLAIYSSESVDSGSKQPEVKEVANEDAIDDSGASAGAILYGVATSVNAQQTSTVLNGQGNSSPFYMPFLSDSAFFAACQVADETGSYAVSQGAAPVSPFIAGKSGELNAGLSGMVLSKISSTDESVALQDAPDKGFIRAKKLRAPKKMLTDSAVDGGIFSLRGSEAKAGNGVVVEQAAEQFQALVAAMAAQFAAGKSFDSASYQRIGSSSVDMSRKDQHLDVEDVEFASDSSDQGGQHEQQDEEENQQS